MSANMVNLHTDQPKDWRQISLVVLAVIMGLAILLFAISQVKDDGNVTPYAAQTVSSGAVHYSVDFFSHPTVQHNNDITYLIADDPNGNEVSFWIVPLDQILSCGDYPHFSYRAHQVVRVSCYQPDQRLYAANVEAQNRLYQISLSGKQSIDQGEAEAIFSSVVIK